MTDTPNTKRVYLKLQAPKSRLDLYTNAIITAIERGWERKAESKLVVHSGQTMVKVTLSREVHVDSEYPDEDVWDCHPESYVFYDNDSVSITKEDLQELANISDAAMDELTKTDVIFNQVGNLLNEMEEIKDKVEGINQEFQDKLNERKVVIPSFEATEENLDKLVKSSTDAFDKFKETGVIEGFTQVVSSEDKVVQKTVDGFEKRPYTLEELKEIKWHLLMKLSANLGVADGKRDERELAVFKASQEQWGVI